jgi:hypothetical protein
VKYSNLIEPGRHSPEVETIGRMIKLSNYLIAFGAAVGKASAR